MIIGIGVDIVKVARIELALKRYDKRFLTRVFAAIEQTYCEEKRNRTQHYAARFAAKEAFLKAVGLGLRQGITWQDIIVRNDEKGDPFIDLRGKALKVIEELGANRWHLSISHSQGLAIAVVILERFSP